MATPPQLIHLAFAGGIREDQRDEVLDPMQGWLTLENCRADKAGALYKRPGFDTTTRSDLTGTSIAAGRRLLASPTGVPLMSSGRLLHSYGDASSRWSTGAAMSDWAVSEEPIVSPAADAVIADVDVCNGYMVVSYARSGTNHPAVALYDATTFALIRAPETLQSETGYVLIAHYSTYFIAAYFETTNDTIALWYLNTSSASTVNTGWVSIGDITTSFNGTTYADCGAVCSLGDRVGLFYANTTAGTDRLTIRTVDASGGVESTTVWTNSNDAEFCDCAGAEDQTLWLGWSEGNDVRAMGLATESLSTTDATVASIITAVSPVGVRIETDGTTGGFLASEDSSRVIRTRAITTTGGATTATGSAGVVYNAQFAGKLQRINGRYVVQVQNEDQNTWAVCDATDTGTTACLPPLAHAQNAIVEPVQPGSTWGPGHRKIASASGTKYVTAIDVLKNNLDAQATHAVCFDVPAASQLTSAAYGGQVYLSGGVLQNYDGERVSEAGYLIRPPAPTAIAGGAGAITVNTGWIYACVYEEIDASGNVHVSGVSDVSSALMFTSKTGATVTVTHLTISSRPLAADTSLRTALYRTTDGGSVYYRIGTVANSLSAATSTYADTTTDAILTSRSKLYRQPGALNTALDRRAWPHCSDVTEYNGMLVVATEGSVQHSGQLVSGEAPWTNPIFEVPIPGEGDVTALAAQDGTLFVFKRRSIYAVSGQPPADNGSGGGLGTPRRLAVDVGCIDPRSVVVTALGVFFQSDRGLEILTRAQSVEYIGQPVQDTVASYPICTAATLDAAASLVRFEMVDRELSNVADNYGVGLVYDLDNRAWVSVDKRTNALASSPRAASDATMVKISGSWVYAWVDSGGYVYTEATDNLDGSTWVTMVAQTAWFKTGGLMGKQVVNRVIGLLSKVTDLDMDVQLGYDFRALETARSYTHTETAAIVSAETILRLEHRPHDDSDCMAVSVKLTDKTPTSGTVGNGTGAVWIGLTLDITPRPGAALTYDGSR